MIIEFTVDYLNENHNMIEIKEKDLKEKYHLLKKYLHNCDEIEGFIYIIKQGKLSSKIHDAVWYTVKQLCFNFVIEYLMKDKECYKHNYFTEDNYLVLSRSTQFIQLVGDHEDIQAVSFPERELLKALFDCGKRFVEFLEEFELYKTMLPDLKNLQKKAYNLLITHNILNNSEINNRKKI